MVNFLKKTARISISIFLLGFVVAIHEFGHLLAGLAIGAPIESYNIGFGTTLLSIRIHDIMFNLNIIPLGGFVAIKDEYNYYSENIFMTIIFLSAGILFNFILSVYILGKTQFKRSFLNIIKFKNEFENIDTVSKFIALLSMFIGILNIIPLYPLDGGKIISLFIYHIFGENINNIFIIFGFLLLIPILLFLNLPDSFFRRIILHKIKFFIFKLLNKKHLYDEIYEYIKQELISLLIEKEKGNISDKYFLKKTKKILDFFKKIRNNDYSRLIQNDIFKIIKYIETKG